VWRELNGDARGLFARGRLMPEVTRAREVLSLMRAGALRPGFGRFSELFTSH
jgi:phage head maturation protease